MRKLMLVVLVIGLLSLPLMAQDYPRFEVFGGYQYLYTDTSTIDGQTSPSQSFNGWDAAVTAKLGRDLGLEGDFGGAYATISGVSTHVYTYTGGPIVFLSSGKIKPFAHALVGGVHVASSESGLSVSQTGLTLMAGGGVDVRLKPAIALRLVQADWLYYRFGNQTVAGVTIPAYSQNNNIRVSSGIVLRF